MSTAIKKPKAPPFTRRFSIPSTLADFYKKLKPGGLTGQAFLPTILGECLIVVAHKTSH